MRCTWLEEWRPLFPRCWRLLLQHLWRRLAVVSRRMSLCYVPGRKADGTGGERQLLLLLLLLPRLLQFEVQVVVISILVVIAVMFEHMVVAAFVASPVVVVLQCEVQVVAILVVILAIAMFELMVVAFLMACFAAHAELFVRLVAALPRRLRRATRTERLEAGRSVAVSKVVLVVIASISPRG